MKHTHNFYVGFSSSLFISDSPGHIQSFDLLQTSCLTSIPDIERETQVEDEHISTVHGVPSKESLLHSDVPATLDVQEAWFILVSVNFSEA